MKITAYRTSFYKNVSVYEADEILANEPPEYMDDDMRLALNDGKDVPLLCFKDKISDQYVCMPVQFLIKIE